MTDFGFTSVVRGFDSVLPTEAKGYTVAWAAPEILNGANRVTREADVFAFGMVTIEVSPHTSSHLVSVGGWMGRLNRVSGFYREEPIQRLRDPDHYFDDYGW